MFSTRSLAFTLLMSLPMTSVLANEFANQIDAMLTTSKEKKSGLTFHVNGANIGAYVVAIHSDYIVVANREHGRIVIRRDRIDAVAAT